MMEKHHTPHLHYTCALYVHYITCALYSKTSEIIASADVKHHSDDFIFINITGVGYSSQLTD